METEADKVHAALTSSVRMLEQAGSVAKVGGWELDLISQKLYWTKETCRIHEVDSLEAPSLEAAIHFYAPEVQSTITAAVQNAIEKGTPWDLELPLITAKGKHIWARAQGSAVVENGITTKIYGAFQDVTLRKKSEDEFKLLNERLSLATRAGGVGIWDYNIVDNFLKWDDQMFVLYGVERSQFTGAYEAWRDSVYLEDKARSEAELQLAIKGEKDFDTEFRVCWKDGTIRNIRALGMITRDEQGNPVRMVGTNWDITESRKIEAALRKSEASIRAFMDAVPEPAFLVDQHCVGLVVNQALAKSLKKTVTEIIGKPLFNFLPPQVSEKRKKLVEEVVRTGMLSSFEDTNGERHYLNHMSPVKEADGTVSRVAIFTVDITDRKKIEESIQASLKEKVALLNEVHHRVKNNLQVITSLLRLEAGRSNQAETKSVLSDMQGRIRSMALLHESLYRSGTFAAVELGGYIKQIATQVFRTFVNQNEMVRLVTNLEAIEVGMDQATPCGLLVNELVSNCFKHGFPQGQGGEVMIDLKYLTEIHQIELTVQDTGIGLPIDFEERRNLSLGLQLVGDLTHQIGGVLTYGKNESAQSGAKFSVTFSSEEQSIHSNGEK